MQALAILSICLSEDPAPGPGSAQAGHAQGPAAPAQAPAGQAHGPPCAGGGGIPEAEILKRLCIVTY